MEKRVWESARIVRQCKPYGMRRYRYTVTGKLSLMSGEIRVSVRASGDMLTKIDAGER